MWNITDAKYDELTKESVIEVCLFITGKPGSGKSILLAQLIQLLETEEFTVRSHDDSGGTRLQGSRNFREIGLPDGS